MGKDPVLARDLHAYMLSVCRQLQMVLLRRQFQDLQGRSYVAGLTVLQSPAYAVAVEYWHEQRQQQEEWTTNVMAAAGIRPHGCVLLLSVCRCCCASIQRTTVPFTCLRR